MISFIFCSPSQLGLIYIIRYNSPTEHPRDPTISFLKQSIKPLKLDENDLASPASIKCSFPLNAFIYSENVCRDTLLQLLPTHADSWVHTREIHREIIAEVTLRASLKGTSFAAGSPTTPTHNVSQLFQGVQLVTFRSIVLLLQAIPTHVPETALWRDNTN